MEIIPYQDWIDKIIEAVPGLQNGVPNPTMLTNSAKIAWSKYNAAAKHTDVLRRYYSSTAEKDFNGRKYWRPIGITFFENLPDVLNNHALRWLGMQSTGKDVEGEEHTIASHVTIHFLTAFRWLDRGKQSDGVYSYAKGPYDIASMIRDFMAYFVGDEVKGDWRDKAHWMRIAHQFAYAYCNNYRLKWSLTPIHKKL